MAENNGGEAKTVSFINLDRTAVDYTREYFYDDAELLHVHPPPETEDMGPNERRLLLLGWLADKETTRILPVLEKTTDEAARRIAPAIRLIIQAEAGLGHEICIYSSTQPDFLVDAYGQGIRAFADPPKVHTFGRPASIGDDDRYTGHMGSMLKGKIIRGFREDGYQIGVVADSFPASVEEILQGDRPLVVNPHAKLQTPDNVPIIKWREDDPETRMLLPGDPLQRFYELQDDPAEQQMFLEDLGYST